MVPIVLRRARLLILPLDADWRHAEEPMSRSVVQITTSTFAVGNEQLLNRIQQAGFAVRGNPFGRRLTRSETLSLLDKDVIAVLAGLETLDREVLSHTALKVISRVGSGISNVDIDAARDLGIEVFSTPDGPTTAVAEMTIGALISLLREIPAMDAAMRAQKWDRRTGGEIEGRTVAVIGLGRIGCRVAELCKAFGATVIGVDPQAAGVPEWLRVVDLSRALTVADVFAIHASGDSCIIGAREIQSMKAGAVILNASRGGVVAEDALDDALKSGHIGAAWLDVFVEEPYVGPLIRHPKLLLTPHIGSYSQESRLKMEGQAVENVLNALKRLGY